MKDYTIARLIQAGGVVRLLGGNFNAGRESIFRSAAAQNLPARIIDFIALMS
ncbi:hypothetical protein ABID26_007321 [Mesorhizobium shonense]|uniref:Uncharacterized protein n=1 Tax=Mesorhizobium shonense TaxID=1209948 RepID=A0ABV2I5H5_9HYPH